MSNYLITNVDTSKYRENILNLFKNNIPGAPQIRLDWMDKNPDGRSIWYLAFNKKNNEVAGSISIMPRKVNINGKMHKAGYIGDFMVERKYRAFGPALDLLKIAITEYKARGFSFVYTYPNTESVKLAIRAGFKNIGDVERFVKPLKVNQILKKMMKPALIKYLAPVINLGLKILSKETYMITHVSSKSEDSPMNRLSSFFEKKENRWQYFGERSEKYIHWKYYENPLSRYRMYTYYKESGNEAVGYVIYNVTSHCINIYDILAFDARSLKAVLGEFLKDSRKAGYETVSIKILSNSPTASIIKSFGFINRGDTVPLLWMGDDNIVPGNFVFYDGDRNN